MVFKLARESGGKWTYNIIHHFKGPDGEGPVGGLILDSSGNLYGTTWRGGNGFGTVFELYPSRNAWKEKVLYRFAAPPDVVNPISALTFDADGNLYSTASVGAYSHGGVFKLKPTANGWQETVIYNFTGGGDGETPNGQLALDSAGNLYGAAVYGGQYGDGVVFELTPSSNGDWTESVLHSFTGSTDGGGPGAVLFDGAGNLYGTTQFGANSSCHSDGPGCGIVFELAPSMGNWTLSVLHAFDGSDGADPYAGLIFDSAGSLYGTTPFGGHDNYGVVFKVSQSGGNWTERVLHSFNLNGGAYPWAGLILDQRGILYGATLHGGVGQDGGFGVLYSIAP